MMFQRIDRTGEFSKDLRKLEKKWISLPHDLEVLIRAQLLVYHREQVDIGSIKKIEEIADGTVYKVKKFACRSMKGKGCRTGLRLIYAFYPKDDCILLIELYFKQDQENESIERIRSLLKIPVGTNA